MEINTTQDPFLDEEICYRRLCEDYKKHGSLVVAIDYDNVLFDIHGKGFTFPAVIQLVRECYELGFKILIYTAGAAERYPEIRQYLKEKEIPYHTLNENALDFHKDGKDRTRSKLYYNVFLDDRAGLKSAYTILRRLVDGIKSQS